MRCLLLLLLSLTPLLPSAAFAKLPPRIEADFAVVSGYLVMPVEEGYLVDLDAASNLQVGDILAVVTPGSPIVHPVSKVVIGMEDEVQGFLQVTRIKSGYSYVKVLTPGLAPASGAPVKRFEQVPAVMVDNSGGDGATAAQLKADLPQFRWLPASESAQALMTFTLTAGSLEVLAGAGSALHRYEFSEDRQLVADQSAPPQPYYGAPVKEERGGLQGLADSVLTTLNLKEDRFEKMDAAILRQKAAEQGGVWISPNLEGHPAGLAVADLDGDGAQETAVLLDNTLKIVRVTGGEFAEVASLDLPLRVEPLSLDALDLDGSGRPELYLSGVDGFRAASLVVEFIAGGYRIVIKDVPWFVRVLEQPGQQGRVLVGQEMGNDTRAFAGKAFIVRREGDNLVRGEEFPLPGLANLFSVAPFADSKGQHNYAYLTGDDYLKVVTPEGRDFWESGDYYGGSETCFNNRQENQGDMVIPTCIRPRLISSANGEILVAQNEGQRLMERYRKFKQSRVVAMRWNGMAMVESWRTAGQQGYLGDFALADADNDGRIELVMAVKFQHEGIINKARTGLVIYEL